MGARKRFKSACGRHELRGSRAASARHATALERLDHPSDPDVRRSYVPTADSGTIPIGSD